MAAPTDWGLSPNFEGLGSVPKFGKKAGTFNLDRFMAAPRIGVCPQNLAFVLLTVASTGRTERRRNARPALSARPRAFFE
jgi:hypothetical protein